MSKVLRISGIGDYRAIAKAIDASGVLRENRAYSQSYEGRIDFIIDATRGVLGDEITNVLASNGMQITSLEIVDGTVPHDPDRSED